MHDLRSFLDALSPSRPETWARVEPLFLPVVLPKGSYFIEAGQTERQVGFLAEGVMRAFFRNARGTEYNKTFFVAPAIVGSYSFMITGQPAAINQQALTDCRVLAADFAALRALYDEHPDLERQARRHAERQFVEKEQRELEIVLLDAEQRYRLFQQQFPQLEQLIPQYHVASYLGITPTQLSRIRRHLSRGGSGLTSLPL
ncbi:Crp/Fnr family transcriptional regulator [Hymenobacter busanensis]|uniref:Crp/Fnr family transcriptional regulator n=1 Tax=Hymenobacter busanensis TaxID=2607656 RepID=A0A7L4ZUS8_9BACT|nr:Crp/Fnr family transcriptional regulator [Hymenobacter busanensis]KAA9339300.1 Crp/Fnr family transcriptional regulator [Hymenobacter busanensis]QHJ06938.1 cyclic nucleotide-binding domain-containing protein [Hymenobacter busanensis]